MKTNNNSRFTILFFLAATFLALASRWLPHPDNFSAMGGYIFLCGFLFFRNKAVLPVAFAALLLSDAMLGAYPGIEWTYISYVAILALGLFVRGSAAQLGASGFFALVAANTFAAVAFFVISNFGVWFAAGLYAPTWAGLVQCYLMALPFLHMTLASQLLVGTGFVFAYNVLAQREVRTASQRV